MSGSIGPVLPPGFKKDNSPKLPCGPCLPPGFKKEKRVYGASLQSDSTAKRFCSSQDAVIGPLPTNFQPEVHQSVSEEFEERAKQMKLKLLKGDDGDDDDKKRESWMTELPKERSKAAEFQMGLQARTFKKESYLSKPKRDSTWTDTPEEKEKKRLEAEKNGGKGSDSDSDCGPSIRDIAMQKEVDTLNKARPTSLLDLHAKKAEKEQRKKEKKSKKEKKKDKKSKKKDTKHKKEVKEEKKTTRVPFDREIDLGVNRFDEAKKKSIIKQSSLLNTKFSTSKSSKFL